MKQRYNRICALALAGILAISNAVPAAAAVEGDRGASAAAEKDTEEPADGILSETDTEESADGIFSETDTEESADSILSETDTEESDFSDTASAESDDIVSSDSDLENIEAAFLYAETSEDGTSQNVIIKLDTDEALGSAALQSEDSGNQEETDASQIIENYALFTLPLSEERTFQEITYTINGTEYTTSLRPLEQGEQLDEADFQDALDAESDAGIAAYSLDDETNAAASADEIASQEAMVDECVITTSLDEAVTSREIASSVAATLDETAGTVNPTVSSDEKKVIVLDPGHGAAGTGTYRDWGDFVTDEALINYKITAYTKEALEANYTNIVVYTTKASQNENPSLEKRVQYAVDKGADLFVSQHINATGQEVTTVNGCLAMVPKLDSTHQYNSEAAQSSLELARSILDELVALGFNDMGFQERLSENNSKYPDGSLADYYGIVKHCRENKLPGIIIEHGFANNYGDALKFNSEAMLKKIGEADARGIAAYLKLSGEGGSTGTGTGTGKDPVTDPVTTGWKKVNDQWYYYDSKGNMTTGWQLVNGVWYYMDSDGVMLTGWQTINGKKYYLTASGAMVTGWLLLNNNWYYLDASGAMLTGFQSIGGKTYYLKENSGVMVIGLQVINGKEYRFDNSGAALSGWQKISNKWYYLGTNGLVSTGWQLIGGVWYYLEPQHGVMQTGWILLNSTWYYLNGSGAMLTGWLKIGNTWYYLNGSGAMLTGWQKIGNTWYYMDSSGAMAADTWIGAYYVDASGAWIQGKTQQSGTNTVSPTASQTSQWILSGNRWWYRHADGSYTTSGWEKISGIWYLFDASGWMLTGWQKVGGIWYYMNGSGAMLTGWQLINGTWYYMDGSGAMLTGWQTINGERYYLDSSGAMLTGTQIINGKTYTFRSSGALAA